MRKIKNKSNLNLFHKEDFSDFEFKIQNTVIEEMDDWDDEFPFDNSEIVSDFNKEDWPKYNELDFDEDDYMSYIEDWECESDLYYSQKWDEIVELRLKEAEKKEFSIDSRVHLAEAYKWQGNYEKALEIATNIHYEESEEPNAVHIILVSLKNLNQDLYNFKWNGKTPTIIELNEQLIEDTFIYLRDLKEPEEFHQVYDYVTSWEFCNFEDKDYYDCLKKDKRFLIKENEIFQFSKISIRKQ